MALVFSQDQDLSEVAEEIRTIAAEQLRWIRVACAFPSSPTSKNKRGINKTDWIKLLALLMTHAWITETTAQAVQAVPPHPPLRSPRTRPTSRASPTDNLGQQDI